MMPAEAISKFGEGVKAAITAGHKVSFIEASWEEPGVFITALDGGSCVLAAVMLDHPGLPLEHAEKIFGAVAAVEILLHGNGKG